MMRKSVFLFLVIGSLILLSGCSRRAWFYGFVDGQKYQCNKLVGSERERCLEAITTDYERYTRERKESLSRDK